MLQSHQIFHINTNNQDINAPIIYTHGNYVNILFISLSNFLDFIINLNMITVCFR